MNGTSTEYCHTTFALRFLVPHDPRLFCDPKLKSQTGLRRLDSFISFQLKIRDVAIFIENAALPNGGSHQKLLCFMVELYGLSLSLAD